MERFLRVGSWSGLEEKTDSWGWMTCWVLDRLIEGRRFCKTCLAYVQTTQLEGQHNGLALVYWVVVWPRVARKGIGGCR